MPYVAEIISVGTELLLGNIINTDARDISEGLSELGINVYYHTVVGDNPERVKAAVAVARSRANVIITTGGLGPTYDDLTKQALAEAFGKKLVFDEEEAGRIREWFARMLPGHVMTENNLQQALLPEDCTIFRNGLGTAPGCAFFNGEAHVIMLPGPPDECNEMFVRSAKPYLAALSDSEIMSVNIMIFGRGESDVEYQLRDMMVALENPTIAPYAKVGEVMLRVTAKAETKEKCAEMIRPVVEKVKAALGDVVYSTTEKNLEECCVRLLSEKNSTLALCESCTGGLVAKRITDVPGSSEVFAGGAVTYTNYAKTAIAGVPDSLIEEHGAVSAETACAMAEGVRARLGADVGVGVTGAAGPAPDKSGAAPGTVFVALAAHGDCYVKRLELNGDRQRVRLLASAFALDMVRRYLTGLPVGD